MSRYAYWDQVLVIDDEIPDEILNSARECVVNAGEIKEGKVLGTNPQETKYNYILDRDQKSFFLISYLESLGVVPQLEGHTTKYGVRYHVMEPGGKMTWHTDKDYSIAISVYLTDNVGGELQVHRKDDLSQSVMISPKRGRAVIMKCDNLHKVLEVQEGPRESIQIFITYYNKG